MALVGLSAGLTLVHASARAQTVPSIDASTWRPSPDADASLVLQPATTPGAWRWNVGAWTQYAAGAGRLPQPGRTGAPADRALRRARPHGGRRARQPRRGRPRPPAGALAERRFAAAGEPRPERDGADRRRSVTPRCSERSTLLSDDHQGVHSGFGLAALGEVDGADRGPGELPLRRRGRRLASPPRGVRGGDWRRAGRAGLLGARSAARLARGNRRQHHVRQRHPVGHGHRRPAQGVRCRARLG